MVDETQPIPSAPNATIDPEAARGHSCRNRAEIGGSALCGCVRCGRMFLPETIRDWAEPGDATGVTALCPFCGIDSVLGAASGIAMNPETLKVLHDHWF